MADSLVIAENIELLGGQGGVASANPLCSGAIFRLMAPTDALGSGRTGDRRRDRHRS